MRYVRWHQPHVFFKDMKGVLNPLWSSSKFGEELVPVHQLMKLSAKGLASAPSTPFLTLWTIDVNFGECGTQINMIKMLMLCILLSELSLMTEYKNVLRIFTIAAFIPLNTAYLQLLDLYHWIQHIYNCWIYTIEYSIFTIAGFKPLHPAYLELLNLLIWCRL